MHKIWAALCTYKTGQKLWYLWCDRCGANEYTQDNVSGPEGKPGTIFKKYSCDEYQSMRASHCFIPAMLYREIEGLTHLYIPGDDRELSVSYKTYRCKRCGVLGFSFKQPGLFLVMNHDISCQKMQKKNRMRAVLS